MMIKLSRFAAAYATLFLIASPWTILGIAAQECEAIPIANFIPAGANGGDVGANCVLNDKELGFHPIPYNKEFVFKVQIFGQPSMSCNVSWGPDKSVSLRLRDNINRFCRGESCYWALKTDGVYYSNSYPASALVKKFDWESKN